MPFSNNYRPVPSHRAVTTGPARYDVGAWRTPAGYTPAGPANRSLTDLVRAKADGIYPGSFRDWQAGVGIVRRR